MARYYLVCEFTPSITLASSYNRLLRVYPSAPSGFVFHDTENPLEVKDILRPLRTLSELFKDAEKALVLREDSHTLAATFSLKGFPKPRKIGNDEWLQTHGAFGWLIKNVNDPNSVVPCDPDDLYSQCTQLVRFTNNCPCDLLKTGECAEQNLYPNLPEGFTREVMSLDYTVPASSLKRVRYKELAGFEYITGGLTTSEDFEKSIRPWDAHDFSAVKSRQATLTARGKARHIRAKFRKEMCSKCCFSMAYGDSIEDCGQVDSCAGGVDASTAWALLFDWYRQSGFDRMPGFTLAQRNYLIANAGNVERIRAISDVRKTRTVLGGFVSSAWGSSWKDWAFRLSAAGGNIQRYVDIRTWRELTDRWPALPENPPMVELDSYTKLACAILGTQPGITEQYKGYYPIYKIHVTPSYVEATGAATRYESTSEVLSTRKPYRNVREYFRLRFGNRYCGAAEMAKTSLPTV